MSKHIIITAGDPLGIGPEVLVKALKRLKNKKAKITVIGDRGSLLDVGWRDNLAGFKEVKSAFKKPLRPGPSRWGGDISYKALKLALDILQAGKADALVTAPVSKEAWAKAGVKFTGHTEVLKHYAAKEGALMMFTSGRVNCALVTEHYPVKDLSKIITRKRIIDSVGIFASALGKDAEIAIGALNPHSGDGGKIGREEITAIIPAIKILKRQGYNVSGPYPVDSMWVKHAAGLFDGIVCMYHDAALTGLKLAAKKPIVHITAGLKFLRTSPAHGTAFDISGRGAADESSMLESINYAVKNG
jgi:4-hydroxythreonine-4-phosphate dehydrogenase